MAQSLSNILVHIVFSTKNRVPLLMQHIRRNLYNYLVGASKNLQALMLEIGGVEDHVHILINLPRTISIAKYVEEIKKGSSKWLKTQGSDYRDFSWQNGYGAFSIGQSNYDALKNYIQNQEEHHKKRTFQDEYRDLLTKYKIRFDEKYVWD